MKSHSKTDGSRPSFYPWLFFLVVLCAQLFVPGKADAKLNVFMLSGQSNMARMHPENKFNPIIDAAFPNDTNVFVIVAAGGQPIKRWVPSDSTESNIGDVYRTLYTNTVEAISNRVVDTYTFVWMQGEADAFSRTTDYQDSLHALYGQLTNDFSTNMNFVIGRISDYSLNAGWVKIRGDQVAVANEIERALWVDTDSFNDPGNALHCNGANTWGYKMLSARFAEAAVELINTYDDTSGNSAPAAVVDETNGMVFYDTDGSRKESITLHGGGSTDSDGTIASYAWLDGTRIRSSGANLGRNIPIGDYLYTLVVIDDDGTPDVEPIHVTIATAYTEWVDSYGGAGVIGSAANDFDGDGLCNFEEYALSGNPTNRMVSGASPTLMKTDDGFVYIHSRRIIDQGLSYTVQSSTNLVNDVWTKADYTVSGVNILSSDYGEVSNVVNSATQDGQYFRLFIKRN